MVQVELYETLGRTQGMFLAALQFWQSHPRKLEIRGCALRVSAWRSLRQPF